MMKTRFEFLQTLIVCLTVIALISCAGKSTPAASDDTDSLVEDYYDEPEPVVEEPEPEPEPQVQQPVAPPQPKPHKPTKCRNCDGIGIIYYYCPECEGTAEGPEGTECEYCYGNGEIEEECPQCHGMGVR